MIETRQLGDFLCVALVDPQGPEMQHVVEAELRGAWPVGVEAWVMRGDVVLVVHAAGNREAEGEIGSGGR